MESLKNLYQTRFGTESSSIDKIEAAGSNRQYFRLNDHDAQTCIGTIGESVRENNAFIYLSRYFAERGLPVPEVLEVSDDSLSYLQTQVGDCSLYDLIVARGADDKMVDDICESVIRMLAHFNYSLEDSFDDSNCFPRPAMDQQAIMYDLNYFKYCFLKPMGIIFDEDALERDFMSLACACSENPDNTLMLRDFQSRNIMLDSRKYASADFAVIDFQGARRGDGFYDLASFAWQARAGFSDELRQRLFKAYIDEISKIIGHEPHNASKRLNQNLLLRILQVLGAYGFRGLIERKARFITSIPAALKNLEAIFPHIDENLPELRRVLREILDSERFKSESNNDGLTVTVMSFSYKNGGIPDDFSGNGGGFVFDCRGMHNPGRYDRYKPLTGLDAEVIKFLEDQGEIQKFMEACYALVDPSVETYARRGFSSLMVCFGCTGGRHRSVYGAEHMAAHLTEKFGVRVKLIHREQKITKIFERR